MAEIKIDRREWLWVMSVALGVYVLSTLPFVVGHLSEPTGLKFAGVLIAPGDNLSYLAKMEEGRRGNWLFHLPYTGADHGRVPFVYGYYLFLGHITRWLNLPTLLVFHLARWVNSLFLFVVVYLLIIQVSDDLKERRDAFLLVALSSGFGWLAAPLGFYLSPDIMSPESNTFLTVFDNPHFSLAQALLVTTLLVLPRLEKYSLSSTILFCVVSALLVFIQPFAIALVFGIASVYIVWQSVRQKRFLWAMTLQVGIAFGISLPIFGTLWYVLNSNPLLKPWSETPMLTPPFWHYLIGYGLIWIGAALGIYDVRRRSRPTHSLLVIWIVVSLVLLYTPLSLQRRFSMGLHIPLAILAGVGLHRYIAVRWTESRKWLLTRSLIAISMMTTFAVVILFSSGSLLRNPKLYLSLDEDAALHWLRVNGQAETAILSSTELGRFVPVFSSGRAVSGHDFETLNAKDAEADVLTFYNDTTSSSQRAVILKKYEVKYVIFGAREKILNSSQRNCVRDLKFLAQFGEVEIFVVQ